MQELLSNTASLTNTLADRDELIGDVITNLTSLMATVDDHHQQLDELLTSMRSWFGDLAKDRKVIGSSLTNISQVTKSVADLLTEGRPLLKADVAQLRRLFTVLAKPENKAYLDETLDLLPTMLAKQTRIGVYGSWYNYYLCEFHGGVVLPSALMDTLPAEVQKQMSDFTLYSNAERCQLMARRSDSQILQMGIISLALLLLVMVGVVQPAEAALAPRHDLSRGAERRERPAHRQRGPGRRRPGRPGQQAPDRHRARSSPTSTSRARPSAARPGPASRSRACWARSSSTSSRRAAARWPPAPRSRCRAPTSRSTSSARSAS